MKHAVEEIYYADGRKSQRIFKVADDCQSMTNYTYNYDYYLDVFDTEEEAQKFAISEVRE